jgi:ribosome maturation factor RimP
MQTGDHDIIRQIEHIAAPVVEEEGFEIWQIVFRSEAKQWMLRVTIDKRDSTSENGLTGVTLDNLTHVHRQLSDLLDTHDVIPQHYTLEVSSPGINRPLLRPSHYERYLGQRIRLQARRAQHDRRIFNGLLSGVGEKQVSVEDGEVGLVHIPWEEVTDANVEHEFPAGGQKKKSVKRR